MTITYDLDDKIYHDHSHIGIHAIADHQTEGPAFFHQAHIMGQMDDEEKEAYIIGRLTHYYCLEGSQKLDGKVAIRPRHQVDEKTGKLDPWHGNKKWCKAWKAANEGKIIVKQDDIDAIACMYESLQQHDEAMRYLSRGIPEVTIRRRESFGDALLPLQCRCDWIVGEEDPESWAFICDLKTCTNITSFHREIGTFAYWWQASFYQWMVEQETGRKLPFVLIAVEKRPTYRVECWEVDPGALFLARTGERGWMNELNLIAEHSVSDIWPQGTVDDATRVWELPDYLAVREGGLLSA